MTLFIGFNAGQKTKKGILKCLGPDCDGGNERVIHLVSGIYHVECGECGARGSGGATKEDAIENWNVLIEDAGTSITDDE